MLNMPSSGVYTSAAVGAAIRTSARITTGSTFVTAPTADDLRTIRVVVEPSPNGLQGSASEREQA
jgi:hypothetical protein